MADDQKTPQRLWKYRAWDSGGHARDMIVHGEIHFSSKEQLNDPFELRWHDKFPSDPAELDRFVRAICAKTYPFDTPQLRAVHFQTLLREVKYFANVGGGLAPTVANITLGVFSATEIRDDILMWSYYGDHHRGICIGIRPEAVGRLFLPVRYLQQIPVNDVWNYVKQTDDDFMKFSLFKSLRWEHENEWRTMNYVGPQRCPRYVDQVVIGAKADVKTKEEVLAAVDKAEREIEDSSRGVCGERTVLTIGLRCGSSMRQSCRLLTAARPTPRHSRLRAARRSRARGRRSC